MSSPDPERVERLLAEETFPYELNPDFEVVTNVDVIAAARAWLAGSSPLMLIIHTETSSGRPAATYNRLALVWHCHEVETVSLATAQCHPDCHQVGVAWNEPLRGPR